MAKRNPNDELSVRMTHSLNYILEPICTNVVLTQIGLAKSAEKDSKFVL